MEVVTRHGVSGERYEKTGASEQRLAEIKRGITTLASAQTHQTNIEMGNLLVEAISHLAPSAIEPAALGALKLLHKPKENARLEKSKERMKEEVQCTKQGRSSKYPENYRPEA